MKSIAVSAPTYLALSRIAREGVPPWDSAVFRRINGTNDELAYVLWAPMQLGALAAPLAVGAVVAARGGRAEGARIAAAGTAAWMLAKLGKKAAGRGRPSEYEPGVHLRIGAADTGLGFPSGHAAVAVTLAAGLSRSTQSRIARSALAAVPLVVGLSRVQVGAHYPLDVLGGWALGTFVDAATASVVDGVSGARGRGR